MKNEKGEIVTAVLLAITATMLIMVCLNDQRLPKGCVKADSEKVIASMEQDKRRN